MTRRERIAAFRQRGLVLLFALIALVALSLAAAALIRTVDTSALIAGNLAFKQAAVNSADAGIESAMTWLSTTNTANSTTSIFDSTHPFNKTDATKGYYSNADPGVDLFADATWNAITGIAPVVDTSGNSVRYVIQRLCKNANVPPATDHCLYSDAIPDRGGQEVPLPQNICKGNCPMDGQAPILRITARVTGPKNTVGYVQAFVY